MLFGVFPVVRYVYVYIVYRALTALILFCTKGIH